MTRSNSTSIENEPEAAAVTRSSRSNGGSAAIDRELRALDEVRAIGREKDNRFWSELYAKYFYHFGQSQDWRLAAGFANSRPTILVRHPDDPLHRVLYFILLDWTDGRMTRIRDFVHARYVVEAADIIECVDAAIFWGEGAPWL
jgi:hypothetical protein